MIDSSDNQDAALIHRKTKTRPSRDFSQFLPGRPLRTADAPRETIGKAVGRAIFASDALSSTAYATQEILVILAAAGTIAPGYVFPISIVIVELLAIIGTTIILILAANTSFARFPRLSALLVRDGFMPRQPPRPRLWQCRTGPHGTALVAFRKNSFIMRIYDTLHMQTAEMLRKELLSTPGVVITEVPHQIP